MKLSDHGIRKNTNISKLAVAWLTRKMLGELGEIHFFPFLSYIFFGELFGFEI